MNPFEVNTNIYIPEEQRDTRYYLWYVMFQCTVPYGSTFAIDELRSFGYPTSFDRASDKAQQNRRESRMLTIAQMAQYWKDGVTVAVVNYKDTETIYEYISNHLNAWKKQLLHMLDASRAPIDELIELDTFANVVYDKAKHVITRTEVDSILARRMTSLLAFGKGNILIEKSRAALDESEAQKAEEKDPYPKRNDMAEYFASFAPKKGGT